MTDRLKRIEARWFPGITARQLSEELGVSRVTLFRWYRDEPALREGYPLSHARRAYTGPSDAVAGLFELMDRRGLSMTEVSERSGVHLTLLSRWRNGRIEPSQKNLRKALDAIRDQC